MEEISINRNAIFDLMRIKEEFDSVVESLELISDKEFMDSYRKSKKQVALREFSNWNDL